MADYGFVKRTCQSESEEGKSNKMLMSCFTLTPPTTMSVEVDGPNNKNFNLKMFNASNKKR